jgi:hypothetical protein
MRRNRGIRIVKFAVIAVIGMAIFGFIVMSLWNWLMPSLFALRAITFWEAWGVLLLSRILFGSFGGGRYRGHWRHRMMERWERMTPEERERFRAGIEARCGTAQP